MAEIIKLDNFLAENYYQGIFNVINSNTEPLPWFLLRDVVGLKKHKNDTDFSFIHMFFQNGTYRIKCTFFAPYTFWYLGIPKILPKKIFVLISQF